MKPNCKGCPTGVILDFTGNTDGLCVKCRWNDIRRWFKEWNDILTPPNTDVMNMPKDERSIDKQTLVDHQGQEGFI